MNKKYLAIIHILYKEKKIILNNNNNLKLYKNKNYVYKTFNNYNNSKMWLSFFKNSIKKKTIVLDNSLYYDSSYRTKQNWINIQITNKNKKKIFIFKILQKYYSNNFGELLGLLFSLIYAIFLNKKIKYIFSDSKLVIFFWSLNLYNKKNKIKNKELFQKTILIIYKLRCYYNLYLNKHILFISGDKNVADFGYHK